MKIAPHLVWKGMTASAALEERIHEELAQLDGLYPWIIASRVVLEQPHRHHRHGRHFQVKLELTVPGKMLTVARDPVEHRNSEDAWASVSEAFATMRRQLEDYARVRRGEVKRHRVRPPVSPER